MGPVPHWTLNPLTLANRCPCVSENRILSTRKSGDEIVGVGLSVLEKVVLMALESIRRAFLGLLFFVLSLGFIGCDDDPDPPDGSVDGGLDSGGDADQEAGQDADVDTPVNVMLVLRAPNGGEHWPAGSTQLVMWTSEGVSLLHIEYSLDEGENWYDIAESVDATSGSAEWTIPEVESTTCLVRISDPVDAQPSDRSAETFAIVPAGTPTITVTSPSGGELWREAEEQEVTWTATGDMTEVDIDLNVGDSETWTNIATGEANDGSFLWTLPPDVDSIRCRVRIQEADEDPSDISEYFALRPPLPPED